MQHVQVIERNRTVYAIIVRARYDHSGIRFFTPNEFSQQLAYMHHPAGKAIEPHVHNPVTREVYLTKEVLFIRKGRLRIDFYTEEQEYLESRVLYPGDVILLSEGGHGFQVLEEKAQDPAIRDIPVVIVSSRDPDGEPMVSDTLRVTRSGGLSVQDLLACIQAVSEILAPLPPSAA